MVSVLVCVAVWLLVWSLWYRIEWKSEARDNPRFTDADRRALLLGALTWPLQVALLFVVGPPLLIAKKLGWWKPKDEIDAEYEEDDEVDRNEDDHG